MSLSPQPSSSGVDPWGDRWMTRFWRKPAATVAERTRRRVSLHLIPYLFFLYILAYLDRVNLSVAALAMSKSPVDGGLALTNEVIGIAAGMFFWGYWILEIPSTLSVERWGARWVFVRILVLWGVAATAMGFIGLPAMNAMFAWLPSMPEAGWLGGVGKFVNGLEKDPAHQLYVWRFVLGFFEGGFFPSVIVYLTHWFRAADRAKAVASFMTAIPVSNIIGTPLSGALLKIDWLGLEGWRWIFILEGIVPILAGFATLWFLPNRPNNCSWIPPDERDWLVAELAVEHEAKKREGHGAIAKNLGMVLLLTGVYFCLNVTSYGLGMFMPKIIQSQSKFLQASSKTAQAQSSAIRPSGEKAAGEKGAGDKAAGDKQTGDKQAGDKPKSNDFLTSVLASLPYVMALLGLLVNGWHSDKTNERTWHVVVPLFCLGLAIFFAAALDNLTAVPLLIMIFAVGPFLYAHVPCFWQIPIRFLGASAAASAIGFINMIGNLGGTVGPVLVGKASTDQASFAGALYKLGPWPVIAAAIVLGVSFWRRPQSAPSPGGAKT